MTTPRAVEPAVGVTATTSPATTKPSFLRRRGGRHGKSAAYAMVAPATILLFLFLVVPVLLAVGLSFTNARLISPKRTTDMSTASNTGSGLGSAKAMARVVTMDSGVPVDISALAEVAEALTPMSEIVMVRSPVLARTVAMRIGWGCAPGVVSGGSELLDNKTVTSRTAVPPECCRACGQTHARRGGVPFGRARRVW